jgi:hypothetical protein
MEVARMRVAFSLVKEHVNVVEKGKLPLDPEVNPMIDPRSVGFPASRPKNMTITRIGFPSPVLSYESILTRYRKLSTFAGCIY